MKQLFILLSILLLSPQLFGNSKKGQTLFFWQTSSNLSWKEFGDKKFHPKYQGDVESNKPNGLGILTYPWGAKYFGEWKDGRLWNGTGYDNKNNIIGNYVNGENIIKNPGVKVEKNPGVKVEKNPGVKIEKEQTGVLFRRLVNGEFRWFENGNEDKDGKYEGEIENGLAHGQGTNISPDGDIYVGKFKDGEYHGQGTFTFHDGAKYVGEFKDGKVWNGKIYNGNFIYKIVNGE
ncbi:molecular chaperone Tir [Deltaproteobacteria bacterium]|nr:molecular chaperone Tir [Deltaproteobacteria bacterium]